MTPSTLLPRALYERHPSVVAADMLGKLLVKQYRKTPLICRITEVEAYLGTEDQASHASRGKSAFNAVLFGPAGYTDVYLIYGLPFAHRISGRTGRVCQALSITRLNANGLDVTSYSSAIQIADDGWIPTGIRVTKRIGIRRSVDLSLRFLIAGEEVSTRVGG